MNIGGINISQWAGALKDQQPYYVAVIDTQGEMFFTNSHFYSSFLASQVSPTPNPFFDLVHESDRQRLVETLLAISIDDNPVTTQIRIKNGHFQWVKWEISCVRMPETRSEKFLFLGYDIAGAEKQKKTMEVFEQHYQSSNTLFSSFMNHTPYFTWILDEEQNLMFANRSLLEHFGLDTTLFGKKLETLIPGPKAQMFNDKHNQVLNTNQQDQSIVKSLMADGKEHIYKVIFFPVHGIGTGMMVGGEALDITESYQARQAEKAISEQLLHINKATSDAVINAQKQERTRIGHELHDNVNQILATGQLFLSLLDQNVDNFQEIKDRTMQTFKLGIEEIRKLASSMVMPDLKEGGLLASIKELVEDLRFVNQFNIGFTHGQLADVESISQSKKLTLFRIIQEQTKNIVQYSKAKNVEISLYSGNGQIRLLITDDGNGFDAQNTHIGMGLSNIYERTRLCGGNAVLTTGPDMGCSIIINLPHDSEGFFPSPDGKGIDRKN